MDIKRQGEIDRLLDRVDREVYDYLVFHLDRTREAVRNEDIAPDDPKVLACEWGLVACTLAGEVRKLRKGVN